MLASYCVFSPAKRRYWGLVCELEVVTVGLGCSWSPAPVHTALVIEQRKRGKERGKKHLGLGGRKKCSRHDNITVNLFFVF